jgi:hypothetical protein
MGRGRGWAVLLCGVLAATAGSPAGEPLDASVRVLSDWGFGSVSQVEIRNDGVEKTADWRIEMTLGGRIAEIWGAEVLSQDGGRVVLQAMPWNREISPDGHVILGFKTIPGSHIPRIVRVEASETVAPPPGPGPVPTPTPEHRAASRVRPARPGAAMDYAAALDYSLLFYEAQRSGRLPGSQRVWWRGDSALDDGADFGVDLTGGYYDAGDHVKFAFPMASALPLLAWGGIEYPMGFHMAGQWHHLLETVRWGTDWLLKAQTGPEELFVQVGEPAIDHLEWTPPERMKSLRRSFKIDDENPGSDVAGEAAAALASASILFLKSDPDYAQRLLASSRELFAFADARRGSYSDSIPESGAHYRSTAGYLDELAWAAAWLFAATGEDTYLERAESLTIEAGTGGLGGATFSWDDKRPGLAVLMARLTGRQSHVADAARFLESWARGTDGVIRTPGGLAWKEGWGSLRYAANAAFLAMVFADFLGDPEKGFADFAERQITYILGKNPAGRSYMVGFGPNPPKNPHHRAAHGSQVGHIDSPVENTHTITGALVGGPPLPDDHSFHDNRHDARSNEVALDYNAALTGALARMNQIHGRAAAATGTVR